MGTLADNNCFLKIDGTEVGAYFKEITPSFKSAGIDTSHGAGIDWTDESSGLNTISLKIVLTYDVDAIQTYIQKIAPGSYVEIEWGPEGATSGKPRHVQNFRIADNEYPQKHDKSEVTFTITANSKGAPSVNLWAGGVYA